MLLVGVLCGVLVSVVATPTSSAWPQALVRAFWQILSCNKAYLDGKNRQLRVP